MLMEKMKKKIASVDGGAGCSPGVTQVCDDLARRWKIGSSKQPLVTRQEVSWTVPCDDYGGGEINIKIEEVYNFVEKKKKKVWSQ